MSRRVSQAAEDPRADNTRRVAAFRDLAAQKQIRAFLVSAQANIRYLTGFTGSSGYLLITPERSVLYTDGRYDTQAHEQTSGIEIAVSRSSPLLRLEKDIRKERFRSLAFEGNRISFEQYQHLDSLRDLRLKPVTGLVERLRAVKTAAEIESIRRSVILNSRAFERACHRAQARWTETQLAAEIEYQMRHLGAEKAAFDTIVASGPQAALPHASPRAKSLVHNSLIVIDQGAILDGYTSDMTRMACMGSLPSRERQWVRAVLEAQQAAIGKVKAGVKAATVDRAARQVLQRFGLEQAFKHSTGHGLGLEIHEAPRIGPREEQRLLAGMVITIEPGVYIEGAGGVRIEDVVVVTRSGCDVLTPTSRRLRSL